MSLRLALPIVGTLALVSAAAFFALGSARETGARATRTATFALG